MNIYLKTFNEYIKSNENNKFKLGSWDCLEFVLCYHTNLSELHFVKKIRGKYESILDYERLLLENNYINILDCAKKSLKKRDKMFAQKGDIAVYKKALGLVEGYYSIFLSPKNGYTLIKTIDCTEVFQCPKL